MKCGLSFSKFHEDGTISVCSLRLPPIPAQRKAYDGCARLHFSKVATEGLPILNALLESHHSPTKTESPTPLFLNLVRLGIHW